MIVKVENQSSIQLPKDIETTVDNILGSVPREHLRGLTRVVFVDRINLDARMMGMTNGQELPGIYHPKQANLAPWFEISAGTLLNADGWVKRMAAKAGFKANLAYLLFSLQAQHYHFTLGHGIKKNQLEGKIRSYTEKYHATWREGQADWRTKLFKPLQPFIERMAKWLKKRYEAEQARAK